MFANFVVRKRTLVMCAKISRTTSNIERRKFTSTLNETRKRCETRWSKMKDLFRHRSVPNLDTKQKVLNFRLCLSVSGGKRHVELLLQSNGIQEKRFFHWSDAFLLEQKTNQPIWSTSTKTKTTIKGNLLFSLLLSESFQIKQKRREEERTNDYRRFCPKELRESRWKRSRSTNWNGEVLFQVVLDVPVSLIERRRFTQHRCLRRDTDDSAWIRWLCPLFLRHSPQPDCEVNPESNHWYSSSEERCSCLYYGMGWAVDDKILMIKREGISALSCHWRSERKSSELRMSECSSLLVSQDVETRIQRSI